mmetsp:Transcript_32516/g.71069  ORF Transcript_32516/g.71069 Transcript_32516/m.71069 type:complete len:218 (+) Transcript_32516:2736-3389(+)
MQMSQAMRVSGSTSLTMGTRACGSACTSAIPAPSRYSPRSFTSFALTNSSPGAASITRHRSTSLFRTAKEEMQEPKGCSFACGQRAVTSARTRCTHCASLCISSSGGTRPPTSRRSLVFSSSARPIIRNSTGGGFPRVRLWPEVASRCSTRRCAPPGLVPKLRAPSLASLPSRDPCLPTSNPWSCDLGLAESMLRIWRPPGTGMEMLFEGLWLGPCG